MNLTKIIKETFRSGGASYNITTGESTPKTGYMVSLSGCEEVYEVSSMLDSLLKDFVNRNSGILADENSFVGTWHNKTKNKVYFDVSVNVSNLPDAIHFAKASNQIAIYDCANKTEVKL